MARTTEWPGRNFVPPTPTPGGSPSQPGVPPQFGGGRSSLGIPAHVPGVSAILEAFLQRVAKTPGALLVKEADIRDNYGRLHLLNDEATRARLQEKYESALALLSNLG